ncbi:MAG: ABC transporter substrate-binding protein [Pseudomonadales bacterium]|nr:ABC transporter substrate-binding protein [Pseudomonadales bacterium]
MTTIDSFSATKPLRHWLVLLALCLMALPLSLQAAASPSDTVRTVVDAVLGTLKTEGLSKAEIASRIRTEVSAAFDSRAMAQSVLSTNWRNASKAQQDEFESLFSELLENIYIGRLESYTNETVEFGKESINDTRATVDTAIVTQSGKIPVNYKLRLRNEGWFVYDVEVENVSLVSSYRETYRSIVSKSGIDGLLTQLREKNQELEP